MTILTTRGVLALAALLAALVLAGCGDEDEPDTDAPDTAEQVGGAIDVSEPKSGDSVTSPVTVAGSASVFEGTVQIRIRDAAGEVIAHEFATAGAGAPERGEFSQRLTFAVDDAQAGVIEAYAENVASEGEGTAGAEQNLVQVPVTLQP